MEQNSNGSNPERDRILLQEGEQPPTKSKSRTGIPMVVKVFIFTTGIGIVAVVSLKVLVSMIPQERILAEGDDGKSRQTIDTNALRIRELERAILDLQRQKQESEKQPEETTANHRINISSITDSDVKERQSNSSKYANDIEALLDGISQYKSVGRFNEQQHRSLSKEWSKFLEIKLLASDNSKLNKAKKDLDSVKKAVVESKPYVAPSTPEPLIRNPVNPTTPSNATENAGQDKFPKEPPIPVSEPTKSEVITPSVIEKHSPSVLRIDLKDEKSILLREDSNKNSKKLTTISTNGKEYDIIDVSASKQAITLDDFGDKVVTDYWYKIQVLEKKKPITGWVFGYYTSMSIQE
ncbi:MAG: hypothetical protein K9J17_09800 [Flavobacteriales bacterium]|nr:hypothetical protein [Flavobacteriales bacterium]